MLDQIVEGVRLDLAERVAALPEERLRERGWFAARGIADLEQDIITRSEVGLLYDDDCFRLELGWRRDNTRVRPTGPSEGVYIRLNLATFGGTGYDRSELR